MNRSTSKLDWSQLQVFLAVAETGSLSAAARRLGQSQPTIGRKVDALEADLGLTLLQRHSRGFYLTEHGAKLLPHIHAMNVAFHQVALIAAGHDDSLAGTVRITASKVICQYVLPRIIADMRCKESAIQIELVPSDTTENLLFREADIAIRMYRPEQKDVIARQLGEIDMGIFAHQDYLKKHGAPKDPEDLLRYDLVGFDRDDRILRGMRAVGLDVERTSFATRCDDQVTYWELVRSGCGVGFFQSHLGQSDPHICQLFPDLPLPGLPVWLVAAEQMRHTPRIRRVWSLLASGLKPFVS